MPYKRDYWTKSNVVDPQHWMSGRFSSKRYEYVWRNISLNSQFASSDTDYRSRRTQAPSESGDAGSVNSGGGNEGTSDLDTGFEMETTDRASEVVVETVDPAELEAAEAELHGEVPAKTDKPRNYYTATEYDHNSEKQWYGKAAMMLDWVNRFSRLFCEHPVSYYFSAFCFCWVEICIFVRS